MRGAADLRRELSVRAQEMALANKLLHELTAGETPSVIFGRNESLQEILQSLAYFCRTSSDVQTGN